MPWFLAKKEVFTWLEQGQKTIDIRRGNPKPGEIAVFQSGPRTLRFKILKKETGSLSDVLRLDNFKAVIPSAKELGDAVAYLQSIYDVYDGVFTAYYIEPALSAQKG